MYLDLRFQFRSKLFKKNEYRRERFFKKEVSESKVETTIWMNYNRKFNKFKPISGNKQQLQNKCFGHESNPKSHVFGSTTIETHDGVEDYKESTQEVI